MKVITFSRQFPHTHPRKGEPTFFAEKILNAVLPHQASAQTEWNAVPEAAKPFVNEFFLLEGTAKKYHTIREGNRWKEGDWFSPRIWSGKPYASKQIEFAPVIQIKRIWPIGLRIRGDFKEFYCGDCDLTATSISEVSKNDGLQLNDFFNWFTKPFDGQIICWNPDLTY